MGSSTSQRALRPYMAVPPQEAGQVNFSLPAIAVGMQLNILIFDRYPQSFNKDVVVATLPS
jgi:hypothetical protein